MLKAHLVGLGSLGSMIALEAAMRATASKISLDLELHDFDTVEERNLVAQAFDPKDLGEPKAKVIAERIKGYTNVQVEHSLEKVTPDNIQDLIKVGPTSVILDCVDNFPTRQLLWQHGVACGAPVLHVGMSEKGMGYIQWSCYDGEKAIDTFALSPRNISLKTQKLLAEGKKGNVIPPCELNALRSLIVHTSLAAVNALFILAGNDPVHFIEGECPGGQLTSWTSDLNGFRLLSEMTQSL